MSYSCLKLFYYLPLYSEHTWNILLDPQQSSLPAPPHDVASVYCHTSPHASLPCSLCPVLSGVLSLIGGRQETRTGRPVFKPACTSGKAVMTWCHSKCVVHRDIFIAIWNSSLCPFSTPQVKPRDKCTSEFRFWVGKKLRSNCEMDIWDLADIAC